MDTMQLLTIVALGASIVSLVLGLLFAIRQPSIAGRLKAYSNDATVATGPATPKGSLFQRLRGMLKPKPTKAATRSAAGAASRLERKLDSAGVISISSGMLSMIGLLATILAAGIGTAIAMLTVGMTQITIAAIAFLALLTFRAPHIWVDRRIKARRKGIRRTLPDALDMIVVSVEAGLGLDAALQKVTERLPGPLAEELSRALDFIRLGRTRKDALMELARRADVPELHQFVAAVTQTMDIGGDVGRVLRIQAESARTRRRQRAQEQAMKAPVKMVFPLVLLVFPSIFIVLLAPAALRAIDMFVGR